MRLASFSGNAPSVFDEWSARDFARVERVDVTVGLFDRQLMALLGAAFAGFSDQDPAHFLRMFFTEEGT